MPQTRFPLPDPSPLSRYAQCHAAARLARAFHYHTRNLEQTAALKENRRIPFAKPEKTALQQIASGATPYFLGQLGRRFGAADQSTAGPVISHEKTGLLGKVGARHG